MNVQMSHFQYVIVSDDKMLDDKMSDNILLSNNEMMLMAK